MTKRERVLLAWLLVISIGQIVGWSKGGYEQFFSYDGTNVVLAAPLQVTRLGVGVAPPSTTGHAKFTRVNTGTVGAYDATLAQTLADSTGQVTLSARAHLAGGADATGFNWDSGDMVWLDASTASGTPHSTNDKMLYNSAGWLSAGGRIAASSGYISNLLNTSANGPCTFTYGALFPGMAAPSSPASGNTHVYRDSATSRMSEKRSDGTTDTYGYINYSADLYYHDETGTEITLSSPSTYVAITT